ncbi:MAG: glycosyltransferase [Candidatus Nanoarchaeia archaeon]|nr:glycosyltransferase [Candidatus Nanoarchaeia archaeon]
MKFSIVIPARKIDDFLKDSMHYFLDQSYTNFEIIIVSDIKEKYKFPKTRIITTGKIVLSEKRNIGAKAAKGDVIVLTDDDAYPDKDWLKNAVKYFKNKDIGGVCGPGITPESDSFSQKLSGMILEFASGKNQYRYRPTKVQECDDFPTYNLFVRKSVFDQIQKSDKNYWAGEDTKLCYDITKVLNKKLVYDPKILVYHHKKKLWKPHFKQIFDYGSHRGYFVREFPKTSFRLTYFIPSLFVLGLVIGGLLSFKFLIIKKIYLLVLGIYFLSLIYNAIRTKSLIYGLAIIPVTFLTQVVYGLGFIRGLILKEKIDKNR